MACVKVRVEAFRAAAHAAGHGNAAEIAAAMRIDRSTVSRVVGGLLRPGNQFIAAALTAFAVPFDDLFEVEK
ncbi:transcriptional regulator [Actinokineospora enzanensis]|uniref:transcriptional regulator n=1 Tax=Actinokineospora enzanensis TaxID=155975 RepID=UPI000376D4D8|nr:transcriptional regulator [Actinokineospora enzanensis]